VRKGDLLATVDSPDEVLTLTGRFLQYYRENANWLERTYDFVPRVGLDELKALLVEDRDGIIAGLEQRMQTAIDAYADPWQEGRTPATTGQFSDALPLIPLPQVPVRDGSSSPAGVNGARA
jgi:nitrite reductase (NADH) large subunit